MRWGGHVACNGGRRRRNKRYAHRIFVGKPEGKRPLVRPRCMWEDNIKIDLRGVEWADMGWIHVP
jgi:hypothetical protein